MKIILKKAVDSTPALQEYIDKKLMPLAKLIAHAEEKGEIELRLEISRTTRHHKKGGVFLAAADLAMPGKVLRAEAYADDMRAAIDEARAMLSLEIKKYKTKSSAPRTRAK